MSTVLCSVLDAAHYGLAIFRHLCFGFVASLGGLVGICKTDLSVRNDSIVNLFKKRPHGTSSERPVWWGPKAPEILSALTCRQVPVRYILSFPHSIML